MTPDEIILIKRKIIRALVSDDEIMDDIVLKGGSAIELFYNPQNTARFSEDLDFSLKKDFDDLNILRGKIESLLSREFSDSDLTPIDVKLTNQTSRHNPEPIPGYVLEMKFITRNKQELAGNNPRKQSKMTEPLALGRRQFQIEFSGNEYSEGYSYLEIDNLTIQVYTPAMIVCEKLRAICQQMDEHKTANKIRSPKRGRARDFYDIHYLVQNYSLDLTRAEHLDMLREMFRVKKVPLSNLTLIGNYYAMHAADEPSLKATATLRTLKSFKFYFDYVVGIASALYAQI